MAHQPAEGKICGMTRPIPPCRLKDRRHTGPACLSSSSLVRILLCLLGLLALAQTAQACQICVPLPTRTLADRLLQSDTVVLAREDPKRPYHYAAVEVLKGDPDIDSIDLFMNSPVRRQLAADPGSAMLLARDPKKADWRTFGMSTDETEQVARRILDSQHEWIPGETNNLSRLRAFAPLLGNDDARLHELAYLEIGRAPYKTIKSVSADVSLPRVRAMLGDVRYIEWRGLDILLLGLSGEERDRARVVREMTNQQQQSATLNLDAWATAYVEVTGMAGIDQLTRWYFAEPTRSRDEIEQVVRALSVHGANDPDLREPVVSAYRAMLSVHPDAAPDIARDLIAWQQWDLSPQMRDLHPRVADGDPLGAYAIRLYVQRAEAYEVR